MPRPPSTTLTDAEQRLMAVLWENGEASVQEATDALHAGHGLAYTTVLSTLRIMVEKGYVGFRKEGRAHIYRPLVSQDAVRSTALRSIVKSLFGGSPKQLAQHLIDDEKLTLSDVDTLRRRLLKGHGKDE